MASAAGAASATSTAVVVLESPNDVCVQDSHTISTADALADEAHAAEASRTGRGSSLPTSRCDPEGADEGTAVADDLAQDVPGMAQALKVTSSEYADCNDLQFQHPVTTHGRWPGAAPNGKEHSTRQELDRGKNQCPREASDGKLMPSVAEIEAISDRLFQKLYSHELSVGDLVRILKGFSQARVGHESLVYECMVHSLLAEIRHFAAYPARELDLTAEFLGQMLQFDLLPAGPLLASALRCVIAALRQPRDTNMYRFGRRALEQFQSRLSEMPGLLEQLTKPPVDGAHDGTAADPGGAEQHAVQSAFEAMRFTDHNSDAEDRDGASSMTTLASDSDVQQRLLMARRQEVLVAEQAHAHHLQTNLQSVMQFELLREAREHIRTNQLLRANAEELIMSQARARAQAICAGASQLRERIRNSEMRHAEEVTRRETRGQMAAATREFQARQMASTTATRRQAFAAGAPKAAKGPSQSQSSTASNGSHSAVNGGARDPWNMLEAHQREWAQRAYPQLVMWPRPWPVGLIGGLKGGPPGAWVAAPQRQWGISPGAHWRGPTAPGAWVHTAASSKAAAVSAQATASAQSASENRRAGKGQNGDRGGARATASSRKAAAASQRGAGQAADLRASERGMGRWAFGDQATTVSQRSAGAAGERKAGAGMAKARQKQRQLRPESRERRSFAIINEESLQFDLDEEDLTERPIVPDNGKQLSEDEELALSAPWEYGRGGIG